ncbi:hypothetical protein J5X84_38205 [Streptosporangiaceae bacterium NEAU-GS5]|nr:hypothetical protein [Streptosporangiaceae bacterium NEAU-GS5]
MSPRRILGIAAAMLATGVALTAPAGAAHANTTTAIFSTATVCLNDPTWSSPVCKTWGQWRDDVAPGKPVDYTLEVLNFRFRAKFAIRISMGVTGGVKVTERVLERMSDGATANTNVFAARLYPRLVPTETRGFEDFMKDDLNLGGNSPVVRANATLNYSGFTA